MLGKKFSFYSLCFLLSAYFGDVIANEAQSKIAQSKVVQTQKVQSNQNAIGNAASIQNKIPIKNFIQWPRISSATISPNGAIVTLGQNIGGYIQTRYINIVTNRMIWGHTTPKMASDQSVHWIDNDTVVVSQFIEPMGSRLIKFQFSTGRTTELLMTYAEGEIHYIGASKDGKTIYVSGNKFDQFNTSTTYNSVFSVNLSDGKIERLFHNRWDIDRWYTDQNAKRWLGYKYADKTNYFYTFEDNAKQPKIIITQGLLKNPDYTALAIDSENSLISMITSEGQNTNGLFHFDMNSGNAVKQLYKDDKYDVGSNVLLSKDNSSVVGIHYQQAKGHSVFFDQQLSAIYKDLKQQFADDVVKILDYSYSKEQVVFYIYGDRNPGAFYFADASADKVKVVHLDDVMVNLPKQILARTQTFSFKSAEHTIEAYMTLPNGSAPQNGWPLVLMPHGGPYARDVWAYDHHVQFLANRGFGVLQVNFRSSTGFGLRHYNAGIKQYGDGPIDDLIAGVDWSVEHFDIDRQRMCVYGASYGGFAALKVLTVAPDKFKCGVVMSGFGDLEKLLYDDKNKDFYDFEVMMMGDPVTESAIVRKNSPIYDIQKIKAPVFVIHGKRDSRIKFHHAKQIVAKLKQHNKQYETMLLPDEGHSFVKRRNQKNFYRKLNRFLSKYIGSK